MNSKQQQKRTAMTVNIRIYEPINGNKSLDWDQSTVFMALEYKINAHNKKSQMDVNNERTWL